MNTLQFSTNSATLLATSLDQTVSIYDVATRTRIGDPITAAAPFVYPGFLRPDGKAAAVTVRDGIAVWHIDPELLADAACELADRDLTNPEWQTYIGDLGAYRRTCPQRSAPWPATTQGASRVRRAGVCPTPIREPS